jgi:tetraacyldisaccharide 4'-kinase
MGGAGKTPTVGFLAEKLKARGYNPAILTRGYRREDNKSSVILAAGEPAPVALTGDEPQIFLREGVAPVGIGADRYGTGKRMEDAFRPDLFLLDDGFQHAPLHRDVDLVLIDGLDPLAGGEVFPLGRLREPLSALRRASAFVITRTGSGGVRDVLARYNPAAPVFQSRVLPAHWVDTGTGEHLNADTLLRLRVSAFCGLANPDAFWSTLSAIGIEPSAKAVFPDHHRYTIDEIRRLAAECGILLTTEKDSINLPANTADEIAPAKLLWLKIRMEVDNEADLIDQIVAAICSTSSSNRL